MDFLKRAFGERRASPLEAFEKARALAGEVKSRQVVVLRPDLSLLALACVDAGSMPEAVLQQAEGILPSSVKRNIAVVTDTGFAPDGLRLEAGSPAWARVGKDLPFFGILSGLGSIGHAVWVFDVSAELGVACRDADMLIIDSAVSARVPESTLDAARGVMRTKSIFVHDREAFRLRPVDWEAVFDEARTRTRQIVFVRADRSLLPLPCIPRGAMTEDQLAKAHRIIPEGVSRNVAVIASTELALDPADSQVAPAVAQVRAAGRAIPFFGLLLNLASAGNPTWVFDGRREALVAGCRNADLLFIDSALADSIPMNALEEAAGVMRSANIAVYERESRKIALLRSLGGSIERLLFRE